MSSERFDRLENQLSQVIQSIAGMQTRIDSIEGTLLVAMRLGFDSLQSAIDDIDLNVTEIQAERNARRTRKLN